jgi:hypothetical protein
MYSKVIISIKFIYFKELLGEYEELIKWIDRQGDETEYNPMTEAQSIEDIALEFTKLHLGSNKTSVNISNKEIGKIYG